LLFVNAKRGLNMSDERHAAGLRVRTEVMGEAFVERAMNNRTPLTEPLQEWINEHAWGSTWQRDDLPRNVRSLVTIAMLVALKAPNELKGHIRGALNNGCTAEEIRAVLVHSLPYVGAPAAQEAFRAAAEVLEIKK
jgi:4-carboxymuconolactone decarboxylase